MKSELKPRRLGEIDAEAVAAALVASGHLRRGVAELFLHPAFVDFRGGGQAGAQRMAGEFPLSVALGQVAAHTRRHGGMFHEAGDVLVGQPLGADRLADDAAEQRPVFDSCEFQPGLERDDGAAELAGAAADFDLAPAGLAAQRDEDPLIEDLGPAGSVLRLLGAAVEPDDFRAPQPAGEAEQQDGAVAQAAEIARSSVAIIALRSSGRIASFCSGGRPWVRRTPASTVATWRSARSKVSPRCANCHRSAEIRRSRVATELGFPLIAPEAQAAT